MSLDASVASRACYPLILTLVETAPGAEGNQMLLKGDSRLGPGVARALDLMRVSHFLPPGDWG